MKSASLIVVLSLLLSGCAYSVSMFLPATPTSPPPTATETAFMTPTETASITPTQPTPTFTDIPTLIYTEGTPTPSGTPNPTGTLYTLPTTTGSPIVLTPEDHSLFTSIAVSGTRLFWGSCEPASAKVTVQVADPVRVREVTIWLRLKSTKTNDTTEWGGGAIMDNHNNGTFTYTLTAKNFSHYRDYLSAWGQYQFVARDAQKVRVGASAQYLNNLVVAPCP